MADDPTVGVRAARVGTGVYALSIDTRLTTGTVGVADALRTAIRRGSHVLGLARARGRVVDHPTLGVGPAGRGLAGVHWLRWIVGYRETVR